MKFGVTFARLRPALWAETAELCDELGYESVWLPEHLVLPVQQSGSPYSGSDHPPVRADAPVFDVFTMLAFFAGRTERIRLGTNVYNIGLRHPFVTARAVATLDVVSGGRVELGIGASWLAEEWDATGLDFATRGSRVDEALTALSDAGLNYVVVETDAVTGQANVVVSQDPPAGTKAKGGTSVTLVVPKS